MRWQAGSELPWRPARATALRNAVRLYAGLLLLAAMCMITPAVMAARLLMPRARHPRFVRATISRIFRLHLGLMEKIGCLKLDLSELDALRGQPAVVIAPNHPSLIDAALVLSRLPDLICVMKADILRSPLLGSGARMAGYITNEPVRGLLRAAVDNLQAGRHLLLFPEGTRTRHLPINRLQRTVGVIAKRAGVPVQSVVVEASSAFLGKGWPLLRIPSMPIVYKLRLGRRFEAPTDADAFAAELESYFHCELATARLPALPVRPQSR